MENVNLTINGQKVNAPAGTSVLKAARQAGIDIPTLCNHPALNPVGICRMCLVEVKGMPTFQPACTFAVAEGLEVWTETPALVEARKFVLDMLFSERNHFCMYCEMSGDCELQTLGYRYGIDHWVYPTYTRRFPVDSSHANLVMEHNRCVLCWRCVRSCAELTANHTLDLRKRGIDSMVHADAQVPFGESSCISCGGCAQICPTGAIFEKRSAFMGRGKEAEGVKSVCSQCSLGCSLEIWTRGGNILRLEGDWEGAVNGGRLCRKGRFDPLIESRPRVARPLLRQNGKMAPASWEEALDSVAAHLGNVAAAEIAVLASGALTNEAFYLLRRLFREELRADNLGLEGRGGPNPAGLYRGKLADIAAGDIILVIGADPVKDQPVASFLIKRAADRGARLIVAGGPENGLAPFAHRNLETAQVAEALAFVERAERPVVLFGPEITEEAAEALPKLPAKAAVLPLEAGANTRAAAAFGFRPGFKPGAAKFLYLLPGEENWDGREELEKAEARAFTVVQAGFESALTSRADVVLPMAIWAERGGTLTNTEGRVQKANPAVKPFAEAKPDWEIVSLLARRLGRKLGDSLDEVSARAAQELK
jgi:formate dehydrogenase major subunit